MKTTSTILWGVIILGVAQLIVGTAAGDQLGKIGDISVGTLLAASAAIPLGLGAKGLADRRRHLGRHDAEYGAEAEVLRTTAAATFRDSLIIIALMGALSAWALPNWPAPALFFVAAGAIVVDYWLRHAMAMRALAVDND